MVYKFTRLINGYLYYTRGGRDVKYSLKGLMKVIRELDDELHKEPLNHSPYECLYRYQALFQREILAGRITNFQYLRDNVFAVEEVRVLKDFIKKYGTSFGTSIEDWDVRLQFSAVADFMIECKKSGKKYSGTERAMEQMKEPR